MVVVDNYGREREDKRSSVTQKLMTSNFLYSQEILEAWMMGRDWCHTRLYDAQEAQAVLMECRQSIEKSYRRMTR
jgi:hypothetical protein